MTQAGNGKSMKALLCCAGFLFLWELEHLINFLGSDEVQWWLDALMLMSAGGMLLAGNWRRRAWTWPLLVGLGWILVTSLIRGQIVVERTRFAFIRGVLCFLVLPLAGICGTKQERMRFLKTVLAVWTVFYTGLSLLGIWSAFSGVRILDLSRTLEICLREDDRRLKLMAYSTVTAANLTMSIAMALAGHMLTEHRAGKAAYLISLVPMLICLSLSGGRTGYVCTGAAVGYTLVMHARPALKKRYGKQVVRICLSLLIFLLACGLVVMGLPMVTRGFNAVHAGGIVPQAQAEEVLEEAEDSALTLAEERNLFHQDGLSGRPIVWKAALDVLRGRPYLLLTGTSIPEVMEYVLPVTAEATTEVYDHVHCMYLQILLETGLPGLGLALAMVFMLLKRTWRLIRSGDNLAMLPLPALGLLLYETVDCVTRLNKGLACMPVLMLFLGLTMGLTDGEGEDGTCPEFSFRRFFSTTARKR